MISIGKIVAYVVLGACAIWLGFGFVSRIPRGSEEPPVPDVTYLDGATNAPAGTNVIQPGAVAKPRSKAWGTYLAGFLVVSLALGLLIAHDFSHFFAEKAEQFIFDQEGVVEKDPEYEEAEKLWADGKPLEAIQLMRDFLTREPRAQYAALRIAEIYEKDLGNYIAAALEYEEVLNKKLPPEKWGWTAIHLANLYSGKLNKTGKAEALLQRIVAEYPQTPAAKKAREHLGLPEPAPEIAGVSETGVKNSAKDDGSQAKLPPGFRPKG